MEIATLVLSIVAALVTAITQAVQSGDWSVLDKPVREVLPSPLRITVERHRAEAEAAAKFGRAQASKGGGADMPSVPASTIDVSGPPTGSQTISVLPSNPYDSTAGAAPTPFTTSSTGNARKP